MTAARPTPTPPRSRRSLTQARRPPAPDLGEDHGGGVPRATRRWAIARVVAALIVLALGAVVWFGQRSLMYHPDRTPVPGAAEALAGGRDVVLTTADGLELGAWYIPPADGCEAAVLVSPGNGGSRAGRVGLAEAVHRPGFGVLLVDYRGYGGNPGAPSEAGLTLDARAARDALLEAGIAGDRILYLGESLGTGVVSELAAEHPPAAVVLRSPMTSFGALVDELYGTPLGWMLRDRYPVAHHVREVTVPVAVVYGESDSLVPPEQSRAVAQAARDAGADVLEVAVPGADHNDAVLAQGDALVGAVVDAARLAGVPGCD